MSKWQPIETAPRDGTAVILTKVGHDWTQIAYWDDETGEYSPDYVWARDDCDTRWRKNMFTHWMPLPEPPPS